MQKAQIDISSERDSHEYRIPNSMLIADDLVAMPNVTGEDVIVEDGNSLSTPYASKKYSDPNTAARQTKLSQLSNYQNEGLKR